jgi:signal transduction histidine kinase
MTDLENTYLSGLLNIDNNEDLIDYSTQFIKNELNFDDFAIIHHRTHPHPYELIYSSDSEIEMNKIQDDIFKSIGQKHNSTKIKGKKYNYYFFDSIMSTGSGELFLSEQSIDNDIDSILHLWNLQDQILKNVVNNNLIQMNETQAALASQLMHDVQAIINLTGETEKSEQLSRRIEYQKKVNKNYLFWTRECDLMKTTVALDELLESSMQIAGIESSIIDLHIPSDSIDISVDVELFAMAFNEVVQNAINAVEKNLSKIKISVSQCPSTSPFFTKAWTIIKVSDTGAGINDDYIPFIMNPFFTTRKESGHSGFGLTNAKKIIKAHQGCIEFKTTPGTGTTITLMIPG